MLEWASFFSHLFFLTGQIWKWWHSRVMGARRKVILPPVASLAAPEGFEE